jgi:hypothetical protein
MCGGRSGTEAGFLSVLQLPLSIFTPPTAPSSLRILSSNAIFFILTASLNKQLKGKFTA